MAFSYIQKNKKAASVLACMQAAALLSCIFFIFSGCEKALGLKTGKKNKKALFEEIWKVTDERYALFSVKNINWNDIKIQYQPQVTDEMSDEAFFTLITKMFDSLKDGHITLFTPFATYTYDGFYKLFPLNFNYNNILKNYLGTNYQTTGPLIYKVAENIGYVYYPSFSQDITTPQLDSVINFMSTTKGIIIDLRNNSGGSSENGNELFSHFINSKMLVKYEKIKRGIGHDDFYEPEPYSIEPAASKYLKPMVILTNRKCFSTCNDVVLYFSYLSNVKIYGDQTGGGGSIPYDYTLANGWKLQYSATQTLSAEKTPIENGITPDVPITITPIDETTGKDPMIEKAFSYLRQ